MPSSTNELKDFKATINISQYAAAQVYMLDRKSSSRNSVEMVGPVNESGKVVAISAKNIMC